MTTKITVGVTRQLDCRDGGSTTATCHVESDLQASSVGDGFDALSDQMEQAFELCRRQVDRELTVRTKSSPSPASGDGRNGSAWKPTSRTPTSRSRPATEAQVRAIHAIAAKANVRLATQLDSDFGVPSPQELTLQQASDLIEKLKGQLSPS